MASGQDVDPQQVFRLHKTTIELRNVAELAEALEIMSDESYGHHVSAEKNDFSNWVKEAIGDAELAEKIFNAKSKDKALAVVKKSLKSEKLQAPPKASPEKKGKHEFIIGLIAGLFVGIMIGLFVLKFWI